MDVPETLRAEDVMTRSVVTAAPEDSIPRAYDLVRKAGAHHLPVVAADGRALGLLDAQALIERWPVSSAEEQRHRVRDLLPQHPPEAVLPGTPLRAAAARMRASGADALLVVDERGKLLGVLTARDLVSVLAAPPAGHPAPLRRPHLVVGVMGSASGSVPSGVVSAVRELGRAVAEHGCVLVTGACPGLPQVAVEGAKAAGGLVVGISPALSEAEHVRRFHSPVDGFDLIVYTGSGLMGREVVNIRSSDMVVIAAGNSGTLGEFAIAYDEGRLIGVLQGSGGVAEFIPELTGRLTKPTGAKVLYSADPHQLVADLVDYFRTTHRHRPHVFHDLAQPEPAPAPAGRAAPDGRDGRAVPAGA